MYICLFTYIYIYLLPGAGAAEVREGAVEVGRGGGQGEPMIFYY